MIKYFTTMFAKCFFEIYESSWNMVNKVFTDETPSGTVYSREEIFNTPSDKLIYRVKAYFVITITLLQMATLLTIICVIRALFCQRYRL